MHLSHPLAFLSLHQHFTAIDFAKGAILTLAEFPFQHVYLENWWTSLLGNFHNLLTGIEVNNDFTL